MYEEEPWFEPADDSDPVWRYMDVSQYMSILSANENDLWFTRVDEFEDPYEGMPSEKDFEEENASSPWERRQIVQKFEDKQEWVYASCWHRNLDQSDAMWDLYLSSDEGIAIKTSVESLKSSLVTDHDLFFANINYIDWEKEKVPDESVIAPSLHKRGCFSHEKEMRVILRHESWRPKPYHPYERPMTEKGIPVSVNVDELIDEIYTAPKAPDWFHETIKSFSGQYIDSPVTRSSIYDEPV